MRWCWLVGHRFYFMERDTFCVKFCLRCPTSYILAERSDKVTNKGTDTYWKELPTTMLKYYKRS